MRHAVIAIIRINPFITNCDKMCKRMSAVKLRYVVVFSLSLSLSLSHYWDNISTLRKWLKFSLTGTVSWTYSVLCGAVFTLYAPACMTRIHIRYLRDCSYCHWTWLTCSTCRFLTLILPSKCRLPNVSSASNFKVIQCQCRSKLIKMLSECQTARIRVRHRVTRRLIRILADCIWDYGRDCRIRVNWQI